MMLIFAVRALIIFIGSMEGLLRLMKKSWNTKKNVIVQGGIQNEN